MKLSGEQTAGRFDLWEGLLPRGAAPPLHSHPQDETIYVIDGELTAWIAGDAQPGSVPEDWVETCGRRCGPGAVVFAPGGAPHTFRVESDTARMLVISTPAGIGAFIRKLAEPAKWPWLQPPPEPGAPRVSPERVAAAEAETGMVRHAPPPPAHENL